VSYNYAKVWTVIFNDSWFLGLSASMRGVFLQLVILCKHLGDTGDIHVAKMSHLCTTLAVDRRTLRLFIDKSVIAGEIKLLNPGDKGVHIRVVKYKYWQEVTAREIAEAEKQKGTHERHLCHPHFDTRPDQTRPDQTRPDQTRPDPPTQNVDNSEKERTPFESYKAYVEGHEDKVRELLDTEGYRDLGFWKDVWRVIIVGEISAYLKANGNKAAEILGRVDHGNWLNYIKRWLDRAMTDYVQLSKLPKGLRRGMTAEEEKNHFATKTRQVDAPPEVKKLLTDIGGKDA